MARNAQDLGGKLKATIERTAGGSAITLSGNITELAKLAPLLALPGPLVIDLAGIERINSLGVRGWSMFMRDCENAGLDVTVQRCAPVIVEQISMISNFMGTRTKITSIQIPYVCLSCNTESVQLVEVDGVSPVAVPPGGACPKCQSPMQVDQLEDMYETLFKRRTR